jgi:type IV secretion system protein VirB10
MAAIAALGLFTVLEARRAGHIEPSTRPRPADAGYTIAPPPPLRIPPEPAVLVAVAPPAASAPAQAVPAPVQPRPAYAAQPMPMPPPAPPAPPSYAPPPAPPAPAAGPPNRNSTATALVIDTTVGTAGAATAPGPGSASPLAGAAAGSTRARSGILANRSNTVPQGTLIPAVLETAFDSTRPGFARAIVSRDVRGFDGSKVLIPRGSRLIGDYQSDVSPGQRRAVISWTRLIRPDGAVIALDSPAVDPLGRGGVHASVNSHFPERVFGALLQSTLQIGTMLAARAASGSVILALPNSVQGVAGPQLTPATIVPTLKVPAATSISVFAARDLEFAGEEQ